MIKHAIRLADCKREAALSLTEVVLALGIVGFAALAIVGTVPVGLSTGRSAQDESRTTQLAQDIIGSIASQARERYPSATIKQPSSGFSYDVDLSTSTVYDTLGATNDGNLVAFSSAKDAVNYPYQINLTVDPAPSGFAIGTASKVTVRIAWKPFAENRRTFVRVVTKY